MIDSKRTPPAAVTSSNCEDMLGLSWKSVRKFCAEHSVPVWVVGNRRMVPAHAFMAAVERASAAAQPATFADELAAEERDFAEKRRLR